LLKPDPASLPDSKGRHGDISFLRFSLDELKRIGIFQVIFSIRQLSDPGMKVRYARVRLFLLLLETSAAYSTRCLFHSAIWRSDETGNAGLNRLPVLP